VFCGGSLILIKWKDVKHRKWIKGKQKGLIFNFINYKKKMQQVIGA